VNAIRVTGTLKAAAALLSLTQPAITQTLQSAERQLGYPLFDRVRGKLIPTREAQRLFPEILRLDEQLQAVQRLAENLRKRSIEHTALRDVDEEDEVSVAASRRSEVDRQCARCYQESRAGSVSTRGLVSLVSSSRSVVSRS